MIAWTSDGIVTHTWGSSGPLRVTRDASTGNLLTSETVTGDYGGSFVSSVSSFRRDGELIVTLDPGGRELWRVDAQSGYKVEVGSLPPDGEWVVMTDSVNRLILVSASGGSPAVWADDASTLWRGPVWEGTPIPTPVADPKMSKE